MNRRLITVLDFDKGIVRKITQEEARRERDDHCRENGHWFATGGPLPEPESRCICGDIAYKDWGKSGR